MEEYILKRGETYTFNIYNRYFGEHIPIITTSATGGSFTGEVASGVTNKWQTPSNKLYTGDVTYDGTGTDMIVYTNDGTLRDQYTLQKYQIIFIPPAIGTYYLNDVKMADVGVKLTVQNDYGDFLNPEEPYHTIIMRRSNRVYSYNYSENVFDKFLNNFIPASLRARFTNLPPDIEGWINNKTFYDPGDLAIFSALISDPEDDILTHSWQFLGMRTDSGNYYTTTISGIDMSPALYNSTSITCSGLLPTPPVETLFRFELQTSDSDNTVSGINSVPVYSLSGQQFRFTEWGDTDFNIGDNDLPYSYYPDSGWAPAPTLPVIYLESYLEASVTTPRGLKEVIIDSQGIVYAGIALSPTELITSSANYENIGVYQSPTINSGLTTGAIIGTSGPAQGRTQHSFELSYTTSVV